MIYKKFSFIFLLSAMLTQSAFSSHDLGEDDDGTPPAYLIKKAQELTPDEAQARVKWEISRIKETKDKDTRLHLIVNTKSTFERKLNKLERQRDSGKPVNEAEEEYYSDMANILVELEQIEYQARQNAYNSANQSAGAFAH